MDKRVSSLLWPSALALALSLPSPGAAQTPGPAPTLTVEQLLKGMTPLHDAFDPAKASYVVRFREDVEGFDDAGKVDPAKASWDEVEYARKGKMAYAHIKEKIPAQTTPVEQWVVFRDGVTSQKVLDTVNILPYLMPQCYNYFRVTECAFIDCYRLLEWSSPTQFDHPYARNPSEHHILMLPEMVAQNRKHYRLRPAQELVDGTWCHVLEWPDRDVIWVDPAHGFLALKRRMSLQPGLVACEWHNRKLTEHRPGLWLPAEQEQVRYHHAASPAEVRGKVKYRHKIRVLDVRFADLADDFFKVPAMEEERLLVSDGVRKMAYWKHPAGTNAVEAAIRDAKLNQSPRLKTIVLLINGTLFGVAGLCLQWRALRKNSSARAGKPGAEGGRPREQLQHG